MVWVVDLYKRWASDILLGVDNPSSCFEEAPSAPIYLSQPVEL